MLSLFSTTQHAQKCSEFLNRVNRDLKYSLLEVQRLKPICSQKQFTENSDTYIKKINLFPLIELCALVIKNDLEYWGIDELALQSCCALRYHSEMKFCVEDVKAEELAQEKERNRKFIEDFGSSPIGKIRKLLWNLTEYPETSRAARVC